MKIRDLVPVLLIIGSLVLVIGCSKDNRTPLQKAQGVYAAKADRYYPELETLKNEANFEHAKVASYIIEGMCSKFNLSGQGAPLHIACDHINADVQQLRVHAKDVAKQKKLLPGEDKDAKQVIQKINDLTDKLRDMRIILTSNPEYRQETRYLNQMRAQSPILLLPYV